MWERGEDKGALVSQIRLGDWERRQWGDKVAGVWWHGASLAAFEDCQCHIKIIHLGIRDKPLMFFVNL